MSEDEEYKIMDYTDQLTPASVCERYSGEIRNNADESGDDINIDIYENRESRQLLSSEQAAHLKLSDDRIKENTACYFIDLMLCLYDGKETDFLMRLNSFAEENEDNLQQLFTCSDKEQETLLLMAIKKGLIKCVERILILGADVNFTTKSIVPHAWMFSSNGVHASDQTEAFTPIERACLLGYWEILELMLKISSINLHTSNPLVSILVKKVSEQSSGKCNYEKCFHLLLKRRDIDIDQQDSSKCSALHYAIRDDSKKAILALLKNGAYIGVKNVAKEYAILNINAKVLKEHLDNCITTNEIPIGEKYFEIHFDYKNLVPISTKHYDDTIEITGELEPVDYISKQEELRHLMIHPIITSFLFLKWHRLAFIFYMNLIVYFVFSANIIAYILVCFRDANASGIWWWLLLVIMTSIICLRELMQFIFSPFNYLKNLENWLEIALLFTTILVLADVDFTDYRRNIAAITILLVAGELFILLGTLDVFFFSTHYIMLITVSKSFFKGLLFYVIILIAFSLSFFAFLNEPSESGSESQEYFNEFGNVGISLIKTYIMFTGEFDAASIKFNQNAWTFLVFLAFFFLISTILFNLLNGLAVSDTQQIKSEAELINSIRRHNLISRYERILLRKDFSLCWQSVKDRLPEYHIDIFKVSLNKYIISVQPNSENRVIYYTNTHNKGISELKCMFCWVLRKRCCRMPSKIIKRSKQLLNKKKIEQSEHQEKDELNQKISNIESNLTHISKQLTLLLTENIMK